MSGSTSTVTVAILLPEFDQNRNFLVRFFRIRSKILCQQLLYFDVYVDILAQVYGFSVCVLKLISRSYDQQYND